MTAETPTTDQVRHVYMSAPDEYGMGLSSRQEREYGEAFDRWLREHDAKVLRDAAESWEAIQRGDVVSLDAIPETPTRKQIAGWLRARADSVEKGEGS